MRSHAGWRRQRLLAQSLSLLVLILLGRMLELWMAVVPMSLDMMTPLLILQSSPLQVASRRWR